MARAQGGEWCRSLNIEMARDNHLTHNSPPRAESCPPRPAVITRLWCLYDAHAHKYVTNSLLLCHGFSVTKCYKSLSHSVVTALAVITLSLANTPCPQPARARPCVQCTVYTELYCTLPYCAFTILQAYNPITPTIAQEILLSHKIQITALAWCHIRITFIPLLNFHFVFPL